MSYEKALQTSAQNPLTWDRLLKQLDDGWSLVLDPHIISALKQNPALLRNATAANALYYDKTQSIVQTIVDGMTVSLQGLQGYVEDQRLASYAECRDNHPSPTRDAALQRAGESMRRLSAVEMVAYELYDLANQGGAPSWAGDFAKQLDAYRTERGKLVRAVQNLLGCSNPFGVTEDYVPLFFVDPTGTNSKYFASSDNLLVQARTLVSDAKQSLASVQSAWTDERSSLFQQQQVKVTTQTRVDDATSASGRTIATLCGLGSMNPANVLSSFDNGGPLTPDNCYIDTAIQGCGNPDFVERPANCYRGTLGEAAAAIIGAQQDVDLARDNWTDLQAKFDTRHQQCADLQNTLFHDDSMIRQHASR